MSDPKPITYEFVQVSISLWFYISKQSQLQPLTLSSDQYCSNGAIATASWRVVHLTEYIANLLNLDKQWLNTCSFQALTIHSTGSQKKPLLWIATASPKDTTHVVLNSKVRCPLGRGPRWCTLNSEYHGLLARTGLYS